MKLDLLKDLGLDLGNAWEEEYKRIGDLYATWGAILVIFMFPMAALPEIALEKDNINLWYFFRFSPSVAVAITFILYKKFKFRHEIVFEVLALFIFASGAYRANCEDWMSQMISNITLFITAAILTILRPYIFIINFILIVLMNIGFHLYFCDASLLDFMLEKSTPIFFVTGVAAFSIAIFRYYLMKNNFLQRLALKKAYAELEEINTSLEEAQEELSIKNTHITEQNEELTMQKEEIMSQRDVLENQNHLLEEKNHDILSSINYAKRIQRALLPNESNIAKHFSESFIFYKPKDIVSGDFFWCYEADEYFYVAAIDCTGHGVPGALMSMMAHAALNTIIINKEITEVSVILNALDLHVSSELKGETSGSQDGFDISLCKLNKKSKILEFSGAHHPLLLIRENKPELFKGGKSGIGGRKIKSKDFPKHEIQLKPNDVFYIYTDGFQDQFGGEKDRKYMSVRFRKLLSNLASKNLNDVKTDLEKEIDDWMNKGKSPQVDDILIMGFRV